VVKASLGKAFGSLKTPLKGLFPLGYFFGEHPNCRELEEA